MNEAKPIQNLSIWKWSDYERQINLIDVMKRARDMAEKHPSSIAFSELLEYKDVHISGLDIANISLFMSQVRITALSIGGILQDFVPADKRSVDAFVKLKRNIDELGRHQEEFVVELAARMKDRV